MTRYLLLLLFGTSAVPLQGVSGAERADPWAATSQYRFNEAYAWFEEALRHQPDDRVWRLGRAVAMLNRAPRTASSIEQAAQELQRLVEEGASDEAGITARYLLARIASVHAAGQPTDVAKNALQSLLDAAPEHPLAQHGGVKLCLLLLYDPSVAPEADFAAAEAVLERLTLAGPRRDGHLAIGRAYLYFRREPRRALDHLRAAFHLKLQSTTTQASIGLSIAEVASELGEHELARTHYRDFLRAHPRDVRAQLVRDRLADLPVDGVGGTTP